MSSSMASLERGYKRRRNATTSTTHYSHSYSEKLENDCPSSRLVGHSRRDLLKRQEAQRHLCRYIYPNDHCGDTSVYEDTYSFWTSQPALAALACLFLAILFQRTQFLFGSLAILIYEYLLALFKWSTFIVQHPKLEECRELAKYWIRFSLRQAEQFMNPKDRLRKTAVGVFYLNYERTFKVAGGYFHARKVESVKNALEEGQRLQSRFCITAKTA